MLLPCLREGKEAWVGRTVLFHVTATEMATPGVDGPQQSVRTLPYASIPFCPWGTLWQLPQCFCVLLSVFVVT